MIPKTLDDWTEDKIRSLLDDFGIFEPESFDFKERLPVKNDNQAKCNLRKTCCAFANSNGGFLIYGIKDDRSLSSKDRIIGIPNDDDFFAKFGDYPKNCQPSVSWDYRKPSIRLENNNFIHIIEIFKSSKSPHTFKLDKDSPNWSFCKRTNKGCEDMSYNEIRDSFLNFHEKRKRLNLLRSELNFIHENANIAFGVSSVKSWQQYSSITFNTQIIDYLLADIYHVLGECKELLNVLYKLRQNIIIANNRAHIFFSHVNLPTEGRNREIIKYNEFMENFCKQIITLISRAQELLATLDFDRLPDNKNIC